MKDTCTCVYNTDQLQKKKHVGEKWQQVIANCLGLQSKKDSKDQESIQSSTTPVPGYQMGK